jgi:hypothetical protein
MAEEINVGDHVQIFLNAKNWGRDDWFDGLVVHIEPYSEHRSFYWVELGAEAQAALGAGMKLISVFNPRNIRKI